MLYATESEKKKNGLREEQENAKVPVQTVKAEEKNVAIEGGRTQGSR